MQKQQITESSTYSASPSPSPPLCMEQKTPLPSPESDNQMPHQPPESKKPHLSEDDAQTPSASKACLCSDEEVAFQKLVKVTKEGDEAEDSGREKLKRRRVEVAGRVWIPEMWGQEKLLKDWIDCSVLDAPFVPSRIMTARAALVEEGRRASAGGLTVHNRC